MKKQIAAVLIIFLLCSFCSCKDSLINSDNANNSKTVVYPEAIGFDDSDTRQKLLEDNPVEDEFISSVNNFSYDTAQILLEDKTDNFSYSPISLYFTLALAGSGADGDTQRQILKLLGASSSKELSEQCGDLYRILYSDNEISKLKIANSLWLDESAKMKDSFVSNAAGNFYASAFSIDFSDQNAANTMEKWISENTNGTIKPDLMISPSQILSIINTIYFCDEWVDRFDSELTKEDVFHTANGDVTTDFMNQTFGSSRFAKGDHYIRSSLNLKGNGQMVFILPDEDVSLADLLASKDSIRKLFEDGEEKCGEVVWKIPKFKFDSSFELPETLKKLGIKDAFQSDADFSGITDSPVFISNITQQTHIAIDEKGVEASAFTQIDYSGMARPDGRAEMILNRPFLYGITSADGTLIFAGICCDPDE